MPRLVYRAAAQRALADIAAHIERESQSRTVADTFRDKLIGYCEQVAELPGLHGRSRHEIKSGYRSFTYGNM